MITRSDYLSNKATHQEYYAQFVTPWIINLVLNRFDKETLIKAYKKDEHFNTLPLRDFDTLTYFFQCNKALKECGDYATLAGKVCILKEAARQIATQQ